MKQIVTRVTKVRQKPRLENFLSSKSL